VAHHPITTNITNNLTPTNQSTTHTPTHLHTYTPIYLTSYCLLPALSSSVPVSLCPRPSALPPYPLAPRLSRPPIPRCLPCPVPPRSTIHLALRVPCDPRIPIPCPAILPHLPHYPFIRLTNHPFSLLSCPSLPHWCAVLRAVRVNWARAGYAGGILDPIHAHPARARHESRCPLRHPGRRLIASYLAIGSAYGSAEHPPSPLMFPGRDDHLLVTPLPGPGRTPASAENSPAAYVPGASCVKALCVYEHSQVFGVCSLRIVICLCCLSPTWPRVRPPR
jgi:hypothetical protein